MTSVVQQSELADKPVYQLVVSTNQEMFHD
jgi:hypothetical protein